MSVSSTESVTYILHDDVLDAVRDLWPTIKGIDILLFQNDLFFKIRQLEVKVEGIGSPRGFLPASFAQMIGRDSLGSSRATPCEDIDDWNSPSETYNKVWADLIANATVDSEEALDAFEEDICGWVQDMIPEDYNFFLAALDEGTLNAEWLGRAQTFFEKAAQENSTSVEQLPEPQPVPVKPRWRSANTRRRHAGFGLGAPGKRRVRLTRRRTP